MVEYSRPEYAERAIRNLNRTEFMGRPVFVREVSGVYHDIYMSNAQGVSMIGSRIGTQDT